VTLINWRSIGRGVRKNTSSSPWALQTYYRWRNKFGELKLDQAKRMKDLE
jgi:hypothetical protein